MRFFAGMFSPKNVFSLPAALLFAAGVLVGAAGLALAQGAAPRMSAQVLLDIVTTELRWARTNVRANLDVWEPGSETGRHQHPGPALLYVLDGELEEMSDAGTRTLKAGQVVWNTGKTAHNVRNRADRPARALAVHLDPGR